MASKMATHVVVAINGDSYTTKKHKNHAIKAADRKAMLDSIVFIDTVLIFEDEDASKLLEELRPTYYIKGPDYIDKDFPEKAVCERLGIQIVFCESNKITSSEVLRGMDSLETTVV